MRERVAMYLVNSEKLTHPSLSVRGAGMKGLILHTHTHTHTH